MASDQYERGLACRKDVLGEEYVEASLYKVDDFGRDFQQMITEYCWGGTWARGKLSKRDRSILNLGMLAAGGKDHEFKLHMRGALNNGISIDHIREILIQIAVYCGAPTGIQVFRLAREVFSELGIDVSKMDQGE